jgi:hypothetical protein
MLRDVERLNHNRSIAMDEAPEEAGASHCDGRAPTGKKKAVLSNLLADIRCEKKRKLNHDSSDVSVVLSAATLLQNEFLVYDNISDEPVDSDPLIWWKSNEDRFPQMAKLAKRYLCIPATSVASERVFSTSGNIVNAKRSKLTPEHVDMLTFLAKNLKNANDISLL